MSTSGTYNFNLTNAQVLESAYALLQIRRPELLAEHMIDGRTQLNLLLSSWSNLQVNLFNVDLVSVPLIAGIATYSVAPSTVMILDAYLSFNGAPLSNRLIFPISRTEYASYSNPTASGTPSVFWFDRVLSPTITLWLVPDATSSYTLNYYRCYQNQDANLPNGETPAIPFRWLDAMVTGLAARLSKIYAPALEDKREADAMKAWNIAATQDIENTGMTISPGVDAYYRT
jgi:hypothetical protein